MISVERLSKLKVFSEVSTTSLEALVKEMALNVVETGTCICEEGKPGESLFFILSGKVSIQKELSQETKEKKKVAFLGSEEFFGEMAFIDKAPYSASAYAEEKSEILLLSRTSLTKLLAKEPAQAMNHLTTLMGGLSTKLRRTTNELLTLYEVARFIGQYPDIKELIPNVLRELTHALGPRKVASAFYVWNEFNDDYNFLAMSGFSFSWAQVIEQKDKFLTALTSAFVSIENLDTNTPLSPLTFTKGSLLVSLIGTGEKRLGLLIIHAEENFYFDNGATGMVQSVSSVLSPALERAKSYEEEASKKLLERNKSLRYQL